jgi:predicted ABC-type ATPase
VAHEAIIIAGPNGAGKSTLAYVIQEETNYPYLSADLIAAEMSPEDPAASRVAAGRRFAIEIAAFAERNESFIAETTLSGKVFITVMEGLRERGFLVRIAFVFVDSPELCVKRVNQRVLRGGHHVPEDDIHRRFYRSKRNFWRLYRPLSTSWYLYYNAGDSFQEVALGDSGSETVLDESLFALFKQDVD